MSINSQNIDFAALLDFSVPDGGERLKHKY